MKHTYYIPLRRKVFGTDAIDPDLAAYLYTAYMRHLPPEAEPGRYDGASLYVPEGETKPVLSITVGCKTTKTIL